MSSTSTSTVDRILHSAQAAPALEAHHAPDVATPEEVLAVGRPATRPSTATGPSSESSSPSKAGSSAAKLTAGRRPGPAGGRECAIRSIALKLVVFSNLGQAGRCRLSRSSPASSLSVKKKAISRAAFSSLSERVDRVPPLRLGVQLPDRARGRLGGVGRADDGPELRRRRPGAPAPSGGRARRS